MERHVKLIVMLIIVIIAHNHMSAKLATLIIHWYQLVYQVIPIQHLFVNLIVVLIIVSVVKMHYVHHVYKDIQLVVTIVHVLQIAI